MNRKILYLGIGGLVLLIILIVLLVVGSSGDKNKNQPLTLTFWNLDDDKSAFEEIIAGFEQAHANVKIEYTKKEPKNYLNNILEAIATGQGPDILAVPNDWLPKYHTLLTPMPAGKLADKKLKKSDTDVYAATFPSVVAEDNIMDQKIYGFPLSIETLELYLNPAILTDALSDYRKTHEDVEPNVQKIFNEGPKTWDEFTQIVQIVTQKNGSNIIRSGAAFGTADNIEQSADILTLMLLQFGAKMTTDDHTAALFHTKDNNFDEFASQEFPGAKALEFYTSFANPKNQNYTWNGSMPSAQRAFAEEKTAMLVDYPSAGREIKRINPNLNFTQTLIPQVEETGHPVNFASYFTFSVNRNSQNAAAAWDFILFLLNKDNSASYFEKTRKTSALLDKISEDSPILTAKSWFVPDPEKADSIFRDIIKQVNAGQNAQTAIEGAASQITNLLGALKQ